eukprot:3329908-Amphidinium_carterae.1
MTILNNHIRIQPKKKNSPSSSNHHKCIDWNPSGTCPAHALLVHGCSPPLNACLAQDFKSSARNRRTRDNSESSEESYST